MNKETFDELYEEYSLKLRNRLTEMREAANVTQQDVGDLLGISRQSVSKYEMGSAGMPLKAIFAYSVALNVSVNSLLNFDDELTKSALFQMNEMSPQYKRIASKVLEVINEEYELEAARKSNTTIQRFIRHSRYDSQKAAEIIFDKIDKGEPIPDIDTLEKLAQREFMVDKENKHDDLSHKADE